jgi:Xaa-Pro aminopeptidase
MREVFRKRASQLQSYMAEEKIDALLLTAPDSVYYITGFWGYLGTEFGRPTMVLVPRSGSCSLITPRMEAEMARAMTWIADIREWVDGVAGEWGSPLRALLAGRQKQTLGIERFQIPPAVLERLRSELPAATFADASEILADLRMIKSPDEIAVMRQAGQVAVAMAEAGAAAVGEGVREYEVALAVMAGGTRKAAELFGAEGPDRLLSPMIYNLPILQSGPETSMVHRRPTVRRIRRGDPVYLCLCGIANYKVLKLGFDREFFVGMVSDNHARIYDVALRAQAAALQTIRPGVVAEEVHAAAKEVYRAAGFGVEYRTGRGIGYSFLEKPQLKDGDKTPLQAGMTLAVDGGITIPTEFGARVGDSIVVTDTGYERLTDYPRDLRIL